MATRRGFLKLATVIPAAALIPGTPAASPPLEAATLISAPAKPWQWWGAGNDGHYQEGPFETREEAISATLDYLQGDPEMTLQICEAVEGTPNLYLDFDDIEQIWENNNSDRSGEDGYETDAMFNHALKETMRGDLSNRVNAAIREWTRAHGLHARVFVFDASRNEEDVEHPKNSDLAAGIV